MPGSPSSCAAAGNGHASRTRRATGIAANITLEKGLAGAKPPDFAQWLFDVWNVQEGDEFTDLFPGTGIMSRAWAARFDAPAQMELQACPST